MCIRDSISSVLEYTGTYLRVALTGATPATLDGWMGGRVENVLSFSFNILLLHYKCFLVHMH